MLSALHRLTPTIQITVQDGHDKLDHTQVDAEWIAAETWATHHKERIKPSKATNAWFCPQLFGLLLLLFPAMFSLHILMAALEATCQCFVFKIQCSLCMEKQFQKGSNLEWSTGGGIKVFPICSKSPSKMLTLPLLQASRCTCKGKHTSGKVAGRGILKHKAVHKNIGSCLLFTLVVHLAQFWLCWVTVALQGFKGGSLWTQSGDTGEWAWDLFYEKQMFYSWAIALPRR